MGEAASVALQLAQEASEQCGAARPGLAHRHIAVRLRLLPQGGIGVLVLDAGVAVHKHELLDGQPNERNVGLYGIMERTELGGGRLHIRSYPGKGVAVRAVL